MMFAGVEIYGITDVWKLVFVGVETYVYGCGNLCLRVWKPVFTGVWKLMFMDVETYILAMF